MKDKDNPDHVVLGPSVGKDRKLGVRFSADGTVESCIVRTVKKPPSGEHEALESCSSGKNGDVYHVVRRGTSRSGPAMVNSDAFCEGWEATFGKKKGKNTLN